MRRRMRKDSWPSRIARWFAQGLLVFVPTVGTLYTVWLVLGFLDSLVPVPIPGMGLLLTLALIVGIGFVGTQVGGQAVLGWVERAFQHLPVVSVLYGSIKDLLGAFVGEKKSFDKPAMVALDAEGVVKVFGFVTADRFDDARLRGCVAVYLPQAYNFAGNVIVVPRERVQYVDADPAQFMAFIVSGGLSSMGAASTVLDDGSLAEGLASRASKR